MTKDELRFWAKVRIGDGCWEWQSKSRRRYGTFRLAGSTMRINRASWILANGGPIPDGLCVLHRCDNHRCVRPDHLFLGTQLENIADRHAKGRTARGRDSGLGRNTPRGDASWPRQKPHLLARGSRIATAKLTEEAVVALRALHAAGGITIAAAGARFGVSYTTAWFAIKGGAWAHVA